MSPPRKARASAKGRAKRPYGAITRREIVDAALKLIERDGASRLSMRKLADELNLSPMAVYYYIDDKDDLLDQVIDQVVGSVQIPRDGSWEERLRGVTRGMRDALARRPELSRVMQQRAPTAEQQRVARQIMSLIRAAGATPAKATMIAHVLIDQLFGSLNRQALSADQDPPRRRPMHEVEFDFGFDLILSGLKASGVLERPA